MMSVLFVACTTEEDAVVHESAEVLFDIDVESLPSTRAISDGAGATQLMYAVFNDKGELIVKKTVKDNVTELTSKDGYSMSITLVRGQSYNG